MRNIIALLFLLVVPASAKDWQEGWDDMMRENRARAAEDRRLQQMREDQMMNQIEHADQARKLNRRLRELERQNDSIQDDLDDIKTRRRY